MVLLSAQKRNKFARSRHTIIFEDLCHYRVGGDIGLKYGF